MDGLDDLGGDVTGEGESSGGGVQFHDATQRLLCGGRHAVCLVEKNDLVEALGERDLLLSEHLDLLSHHVDSTSVYAR